MTLVDTNVLLDVFTADPQWSNWSERQLGIAEIVGPLIINDIVYAELSAGFKAQESLEAALIRTRITIASTPREALFFAGKAFQRYRASGGQRTGVLPDFFIGAHAAAANLPLLTRDAKRYRTYFPTIELITP